MSECPKCGTTRDEARANCRTCGLAHDKMAAFDQAHLAGSDVLARAWQHTTEHWDDLARHDEVLRLATQNDAYAWAAARYRERTKATPGDAIAREQLDRVRRAAEATLVANALARPSKTKEPYRGTMAILGLLIIAIIAGLVYVIARGDQPGAPRRDMPPAHAK